MARRPQSRSRWPLYISVAVLVMDGALGEGEKPSSGSMSGETRHPVEAVALVPPTTPSPSKNGETLTSTISPAADTPPPSTSPPVPPKPAVVEPSPPANTSPTPIATAVPTAGNVAFGASPPAVSENRRAAPPLTMASNTTKPSDLPPSPAPILPATEVPNSSNEMPLTSPTTPAELPHATVPDDTIHFVPTPVTTVPVPQDSSTTMTSHDKSNVASYSAIGGSLLLVIVVVVGFLFFRRNRESKLKLREDRTLAMSEMFLSSTSHREESTPAHVLQLDAFDDPTYADSIVSHEVEDDASSQASIPPSPESMPSDPSDSYRSSYFGDTSNSLSGFFDDPPLSGSSDCSSTFYGHDSVGYDSDVDL